MPAYLIVQGDITDEARAHYSPAVRPLIAKYGGKAVVRGGNVEVLEGQHDGRRTVIFEFPSMDAIRAFWTSAEYQPVKELRAGGGDLDIWAIEGV
jgi:uncharacterized protein (DUF1330 family)